MGIMIGAAFAFIATSIFAIVYLSKRGGINEKLFNSAALEIVLGLASIFSDACDMGTDIMTCREVVKEHPG